MFEYRMEHNLYGIHMFLDFGKAFESIEWNFLFKTPRQFDFENNFIKRIFCIQTYFLTKKAMVEFQKQ